MTAEYVKLSINPQFDVSNISITSNLDIKNIEVQLTIPAAPPPTITTFLFFWTDIFVSNLCQQGGSVMDITIRSR